MKTIISTILIAILFSCNKQEERVIKEFYKNGNLRKEYQVDSDNKRNGYFNIYYESGKIKEKRKYLNDTIIDEFEFFNEDGNITDKAFSKNDSSYVYNYKNNELVKKGFFLKDNHNKKNYNAWFHFYNNGKVYKKLNYINISKDSAYLNQSIEYNDRGTIDSTKSNFFNLIIKDTVTINEIVLGKIDVSSNADEIIGFFTVGSENIDKNFKNINEIKLDTFYQDDFPAFVFRPKKKGKRVLRGKFSMQYMVIKKNEADTSSVNVSVNKRHFYFEKKIYVRDTINNK